MSDRLPTDEEVRILAALSEGKRARRVPREYVNKMPQRFIRQRGVGPTVITALISAKWIEDISTSAQREEGDAIYVISVRGRTAYAARVGRDQLCR